MGFTSTLCISSRPQLSMWTLQPQRQRLPASHVIDLDNNNAPQLLLLSTSHVRSRRRSLSSRSLVLRVASDSACSGVQGGSSSRSTSGWRVYWQSQSENSLAAPVKQIASFAVPAGVFLSVTFVLWKLLEKLFVPRISKGLSVESKSTSQGTKWTFAVGTNLLSKFGSNIDRPREKLNEFAKALRSSPIIDMSGTLTGKL